jgi:hypothetical protein
VKGGGRGVLFPALLLALALAGARAPGAHAQPAAWHLAVDNDYFNFWQPPRQRPDFGYTHGTELVVRGHRIPALVKALAPAALERADARFGAPGPVFALRQAIYVPWRRTGDRPYAGWLELGLGIRKESAAGFREGRLRLGVTGPPSLAERTQSMIHRGFGFGRGPGWGDQLPFEPGASVEYGGASRVLAAGGERGGRLAAATQWRARLGTFATDARLGLDVVLGFDPPPPWREARFVPRGDALYLIAGARVDLVARDEFLDGTFFRTSPEAGKHSAVPELEYGVGTQIRSARLEWRITRRGREFDDQPELHTYSRLAFSWTPAP